jgi:ribonuclease HI
MAKQKFYTVWVGRNTGVFDTWEQCKAQIHEFPKAKYKSFGTKNLAEEAFANAAEYINEANQNETESPEPIAESICVHSYAISQNIIGYAGYHTSAGDNYFKFENIETNHIHLADFVGLVHALAYCKEKSLALPIYSNSQNAINAIETININRLQINPNTISQQAQNLINRAIQFLQNNTYINPILAWQTKNWGVMQSN